MHTFTYPLLYKLLFRYGNIPASLLLLFYLYVSAAGLDNHILNLVPLVLNLILLYFLNKHYINLYKIIPYKIEADNEKLTGSDYIFSQKKVTIYYKDITDLKGGIFEGKISGVMKVYEGQTSRVMGFFGKLKNVDKLQTLILSKVNRQIYDAVIERIGMKNLNQKSKK